MQSSWVMARSWAEFKMLLREDYPKGITKVGLCAMHTAKYLQYRFLQRCSFVGCERVGTACEKGVQLCLDHARPKGRIKKTPKEGEVATSASSRRTRSRSRSRRTRSRTRRRQSIMNRAGG